ncbi:hypothetical protein ABIC09_005865 [Bradyrhizobium sp. S3.12.5]
MRKRYEIGQTLLSFRFLLQDKERLPNSDGHQWGRRGGENEWTAAIDQEVAQRSCAGQQRAGGPQSLATRMKHQDILPLPKGRRQSSSLLAIHARGLVDHQKRVIPIGYRWGYLAPRTRPSHGLRTNPPALTRRPFPAHTNPSAVFASASDRDHWNPRPPWPGTPDHHPWNAHSGQVSAGASPVSSPVPTRRGWL